MFLLDVFRKVICPFIVLYFLQEQSRREQSNTTSTPSLYLLGLYFYKTLFDWKIFQLSVTLKSGVNHDLTELSIVQLQKPSVQTSYLLVFTLHMCYVI